jgi:hypothetical protein
MQEEQRGIVAVFTTDSHPLIDPANADIPLLINSIGSRDNELLRLPAPVQRAK